MYIIVVTLQMFYVKHLLMLLTVTAQILLNRSHFPRPSGFTVACRYSFIYVQYCKKIEWSNEMVIYLWNAFLYNIFLFLFFALDQIQIIISIKCKCLSFKFSRFFYFSLFAKPISVRPIMLKRYATRPKEFWLELNWRASLILIRTYASAKLGNIFSELIILSFCSSHK